MHRTLAAIAVLLVSAALHAQSADLRVSVQVDPIQHAGYTMYFNIFVTNNGPAVARNVVLNITTSGFPDAMLPCPGGRCPLGDVAPNQSPFVPQFRQELPKTSFSFSAAVSVSSDTPDPDPTNNSVTKNIRVTTSPRLLPSLNAYYLVDPGQPFDMTLGIQNDSYFPAHDVVATVFLPPGTVVKSLPPECRQSAYGVTCNVPLVAPFSSSAPLILKLIAPPTYGGGQIVFAVEVHSQEIDFGDGSERGTTTLSLYRTFLVTTTADSGSGSLRAAIGAANAACRPPGVPIPPAETPCAISFNIAEASETPWKTIRVQTPLPHVTGYSVKIDGATQAGFSGVANPDGPSIELTGGGTVDGDGLYVGPFSCGTAISGLAINGFGGNGVSLTGACSSYGLTNNYIGTDPTGTIAVPNFRGIGSIQDGSFYSWLYITGNVISGNVRSAMFMAGKSALMVTNNRIGVKAHADEPLPNGASGMYLSESVGHADIRNNVIAFNREIGIALHPASLYVEMHGNKIWDNGGLAIDDGLDGRSSSVKTDGSPLAVPLVTSAVYDPAANETTIRVSAGGPGTVELFAGDKPHGDARRVLGVATCSSSSDCQAGRYFLKVKDDLRGQWVAATQTQRARVQPALEFFTLSRTTELSLPLEVQ